MRNRAHTRARAFVVGLGACAVLAVPAISLAANPENGKVYAAKPTSKYPFTSASVSKDGKHATLYVPGGKCAGGGYLDAKKPTKATISHGKLTYSGKASDTAVKGGVSGTLKVTGKFVTTKKLKWTTTFKHGSCTFTDHETLTAS